MRKIIVYCELDLAKGALDDVSYELITKAKEIANEGFLIEAVTLGSFIDNESVKKAYWAGANQFVFIKSETLASFSQRVFSQCFIEYYNQNPAEIIIFPATKTGRMVAPRITTALDTGLVADCTELALIEKDNQTRLAPTRPTFGSELMATILSKKNPQCATIRPNTFVAKFDENNKGEYIEYHPTATDETQIKLLRSLFDNHTNKTDFSNAKIVFCAGFGITEGKNKIYFEKLEKLAQYFGAKVASTRKVVDYGIMPHNTQIGQTGSTISPDIYIAFGISGAIQHIMGMKNSKTIISINTDENAEIFKYSDYKIVADAKKIIDELYNSYIN